MTYNFNRDQIEILNVLAFDADIDRESFDNLKVRDSKLEIPIDRITLESVQRKKFLFFNQTHFETRESLLQFYNVREFHYVSPKNKDIEDLAILTITSEKPDQIRISTNIGRELIIDFLDEISIALSDRAKSFNRPSKVFGTVGYTNSEWVEYLKTKQYTT